MSFSITGAIAKEDADNAFNNNNYTGKLRANQLGLGLNGAGLAGFKTFGFNLGFGKSQDTQLETKNSLSTQTRIVNTGTQIQTFIDTFNTPTITSFNGASWAFGRLNAVLDVGQRGELVINVGADKRSDANLSAIGGLRYMHYMNDKGKLEINADAVSRQQTQY